MDLRALYRRSAEYWLNQLTSITEDQWELPTPCPDWTVRQLVAHIVAENRWTVPLVEGQTLAEIGSRFDGDLLGDDPIAAALAAAQTAENVVLERLPQGGKVHLSYGEEELGEYVRQLAADHLIHGWDLAAAIGGNTTLDPQLVAEVAAWFAEREDAYRGSGAIGPRSPLSGDPQSDLLAGFGRRAGWSINDSTLARFSKAFGAGDVPAIMALMTDDCVFESTSPAPDGHRYEGADAVRAVWAELFTKTPDPVFTEEEAFVCGDRAVLRWRFDWGAGEPDAGHVRGVDVLRLRDGKVCEKLSYVKG